MDKLHKKTLDVSRGFTYAYYTSLAKDGLQTVLLVHGFPSTVAEWSGVISDYLLPNGYGVLVLDCLGYAGSSKPTDMKAYNLQYLVQDIKEILDKESLDKVVSLGHDWVSSPCSSSNPQIRTSHNTITNPNRVPASLSAFTISMPTVSPAWPSSMSLTCRPETCSLTSMKLLR